jgi:acetyl esterase/lipase
LERFKAFGLVRATVLLVLTVVTPARAAISFSDLLARPRPAPTHIIAYGLLPDQHGELWLPSGKGPFPVVVAIHGGCWLANLPGTALMAYQAEDLRRRGIAVWNIEYRRIGDGGGYPETFQDVGRAIDRLRDMGPRGRLDLNRVVLAGHSAGGQLALWAAARRRLARTDPLYTPNPLPVRGVVALAGIADLAAYRADGPEACGGPETIDALTGAAAREGRGRYADTSPAELLPLGVRQVIVSGALDPIVPARFGAAYAAKARAKGDLVQAMTLPGAGHFELIDPTSAAWKQIEPTIEALLK